MILLIDPKKVSFFEDSTNLKRERVVEIIIDGVPLSWDSGTYDSTYLDSVSDYIKSALENTYPNNFERTHHV